MAYEPIEGLEIQPEQEDQRSKRTLLAAAGVLALVIVLVLILLLLPRCTGDGDAKGSGQKRQIVAIPDVPAEAGVVSVWIRDDLTISSVLGKAGLPASAASDLGGGRYVVDVEPGTERESVKLLRETQGVYDAGFVFTDDAAATAQ